MVWRQWLFIWSAICRKRQSGSGRSDCAVPQYEGKAHELDDAQAAHKVLGKAIYTRGNELPAQSALVELEGGSDQIETAMWSLSGLFKGVRKDDYADNSK